MGAPQERQLMDMVSVVALVMYLNVRPHLHLAWTGRMVFMSRGVSVPPARQGLLMMGVLLQNARLRPQPLHSTIRKPRAVGRSSGGVAWV